MDKKILMLGLMLSGNVFGMNDNTDFSELCSSRTNRTTNSVSLGIKKQNKHSEDYFLIHTTGCNDVYSIAYNSVEFVKANGFSIDCVKALVDKVKTINDEHSRNYRLVCNAIDEAIIDSPAEYTDKLNMMKMLFIELY